MDCNAHEYFHHFHQKKTGLAQITFYLFDHVHDQQHYKDIAFGFVTKNI